MFRALFKACFSPFWPFPPDHTLAFRIPFEIWCEIVKFLPISSQASLSISCRWFRECLGTRAFTALRQDKHEQMCFLQLSDYKRPRQLFCSKCKVYYYWRGPYEKLGHSRCFQIRDYAVLSLFMPHINFCQVQMAARVARHGRRHGLPLSDYEEETRRGWHVSFSTAFVEEHLLTNITTTKQFEIQQVTTEDRVRFEVDVSCNGAQCGHYGAEIESLALCARRHVAERTAYNECSICQPLYRCEICATEYLIRARLIKRGGFELSIFRWSDWGDGLSPYSREWQGATNLSARTKFGVFDLRGLRNVRSRYELARKGLSVAEEEPIALRLRQRYLS